MTYFQNPFASEFRGNWVLGDRQHSLTFSCPANTGRSDELIAAWKEPIGLSNSYYYDLSGNDADGNSKNILVIRVSVSGDFKNWNSLEINLTENSNANLNPAPNSSSMSPSQIVQILNANPTFSSYFVANLERFASLRGKIVIRQKFPATRMKYFVVNGRAEEVLGFNARAGVAELPSYFKRHRVYGGNSSFPLDGTNAIVELSPSNSGGDSSVDDNVIDNATDHKGISLGFDSSNVREDYELIAGRASGLFTFQKITVDGSDRITQIIEYPAGASVGDHARKINYTYGGSNTNPSAVTEIPYVLSDGDLITP
jgi:hypothetical protein